MDEQTWLKETETDCNYAFWKQLLAWQFFKVHLLFFNVWKNVWEVHLLDTKL